MGKYYLTIGSKRLNKPLKHPIDTTKSYNSIKDARAKAYLILRDDMIINEVYIWDSLTEHTPSNCVGRVGWNERIWPGRVCWVEGIKSNVWTHYSDIDGSIKKLKR